MITKTVAYPNSLVKRAAGDGLLEGPGEDGRSIHRQGRVLSFSTPSREKRFAFDECC
jgi:hypothetical protein